MPEGVSANLVCKSLTVGWALPSVFATVTGGTCWADAAFPILSMTTSEGVAGPGFGNGVRVVFFPAAICCQYPLHGDGTLRLWQWAFITAAGTPNSEEIVVIGFDQTRS